jgi:hypothetical protein
MAILKVKNTQGEWQSIPAFKGDKGDPGKDGAIQYTAGNGIKIEGNVISATGEGGGEGGSNANTIPIVKSTKANIYNYTNTPLTEEDAVTFTNLLNMFAEKGEMLPGFILECDVTGSPTIKTRTRYFHLEEDRGNEIYYKASHIIHAFGENKFPSYHDVNLYLTYTKSNGVYTCTAVNIYGISVNFLAPYNSASYTPTSDYNPATKKYVDDSIKTAITDTLGGSY